MLYLQKSSTRLKTIVGYIFITYEGKLTYIEIQLQIKEGTLYLVYFGLYLSYICL